MCKENHNPSNRRTKNIRKIKHSHSRITKIFYVLNSFILSGQDTSRLNYHNPLITKRKDIYVRM